MRLSLVVVALAIACAPRDAPRVAPAVHADVARPRGPSSSRSAPPIEAPALRLPDTATPLAYDLRLELDPARDTFRGHVEITIRLDRPSDHVWLHASRLELASAGYRAGGATRPLTTVGTAPAIGALAFGFGAPRRGELTLIFDYTGHVGRSAAGVFRQHVAGQTFLYTQAEAMFARRILPCFDEPRWKSAWRVTVVVPGGAVALGNGPERADTALPDGRHEVRFAEVAGLPSYLFAVAVGPFTVIDAGRVGRARVPVRIAVAPEHARELGAIPARLSAIVDALERYLDRPLPLAKLDLVAVPRFFGAMENVGLITFQAGLLAVGRDATRLQRFTRFATHELAHQWIGNAVTPAWWDDLWLAEAVTTWLADKLADPLGAKGDPLRAPLARLDALAADDAPGARPLRPTFTAAADVDAWFDAISYDKGSAVLAMVERHVGAAAFRDALRGYVAAHAGTSVTAEALLSAIARGSPSGADVLRGYLDRTGAPVVEVAAACDATPPRLAIDVRGGPRVPVCVRYDTGGAPAEACRAIVDHAELPVARCPRWVIGNAGGVGYYRVAAPALAIAAPMTPAERLAFADDVAAALDRGELAVGDAVRALRTLAAGDAAARLAAVVIAEAIDPLVDDATRPAWTRWLAARFSPGSRRLLAARAPVELELRDRLPALIGDRFDAATVKLARRIVERAVARDQAPPESALAIAAARIGAPLFDRIVARAAAVPDADRADVLASLGAFGPALAPRVIELMTGGRFAPAAVRAAVEQLLGRPATRTAAWRALRDRAAALPRAELDAVVDATSGLCEPDAAREVAARFTASPARAKAIAAIERCVARRAHVAGLAGALR